MENPNWHFLKSGSGIVGASNLANPLKDTQLKDYEILVREAFQNSYDERISEDNFKFKIKKHLIGKEQCKKFIEAFDLKQIYQQSKYFDDTNNYISNGMKLLKKSIEEDKDFSILEVSDFNSNGLSGRWNRGRSLEDRFYNLVLSINRSRKQDANNGENYLGSYGVGKMVFALSSEIRSILYYSKFLPTDASITENTRLMMTSFLPLIDNQEDDTEYSGHAYFGIESNESNNPIKPLINNQADKFISDLGFNVRQENEYGTSVYLPFCNFEIQEIKTAFEKWWWPALTRNPKILIELEDEFGNIFHPDPANNQFSKPFIEIFKKEKEPIAIIHEGKKKVIANFKLEKFNNNHDIESANKLACIRGGLVIEYKNPFKEGEEDCFGIVKINNLFEQFFAFSEPETHDKWNPNHGRLLSRFGDTGQRLVNLGLNQFNTRCRDFQKSLSTIEKNQNYSGTKFLDTRLSQLFKSLRKGKPNSPPATNRLPYIHKTSERIIKNNLAVDHLSFSIGLNDNLEVDNIDYKLKIVLMSVVDTNNSKGEIIPVELLILNDNNQTPNTSSNGIVHFSLNNTKIIKGEAKGKVFSKWTTKWLIELNPVDL